MDNTLKESVFGKQALDEGMLYNLPLSRFPFHLRGAGEEENVRVPNEVAGCVAFLAVDIEQEDGSLKRIPGGTAFQVLLIDDDGKGAWPYFVTARHNIENSSQDKIYVRVNNDYRSESGYVDAETRRDQWIKHDTADVAILSLHHLPPARQGVGVKIAGVDLKAFIDLDVYKDPRLPKGLLAHAGGIQIDVGDDVFIMGLFVQRPGKERNLPIARFGAISRMPHEPIRMEREPGAYFDAQAYLVEVKSWGGHSGSPVFWTIPISVTMQTPTGEFLHRQEWARGLLGLVSAHDDIRQKAERSGEFHNLAGDIITKANSGIAIVTPATAIKELIMREDVVKDRELRRRLAKSDEPIPTMDTGLSQTGNIFTFEDFNDALKRASRKISPPDEETKET